jgi:hypothetical protein
MPFSVRNLQNDLAALMWPVGEHLVRHPRLAERKYLADAGLELAGVEQFRKSGESLCRDRNQKEQRSDAESETRTPPGRKTANDL